jgi:hypothetical protein
MSQRIFTQSENLKVYSLFRTVPSNSTQESVSQKLPAPDRYVRKQKSANKANNAAAAYRKNMDSETGSLCSKSVTDSADFFDLLFEATTCTHDLDPVAKICDIGDLNDSK